MNTGRSGPPAHTPETVLVVEDESLIRWALKEALADAGYAVVEAADAQAALMHLEAGGRPVDAVVLDVRLPDANGLTLLPAIHRLDPDCPVIVMSAYLDAELAKEATTGGAYLSLGKPFSPAAMVSSVRSALEHR